VSAIRLTQLDGKLPNLALMKLSAHHKARGDAVHFYRTPYRQLGEPAYAAVYGSAIFAFSADRVDRFSREFPEAIIGGTGSGNFGTVEALIGETSAVDYEPWPNFTASLGFTQRGCRLSCKFCVVPTKEGKPRAVAAIPDIWRGEPWPRHLHLLDNDFFGQPEDQWRARVAEIRAGGFKVCFSQGVNVRVMTAATAAALASVDYRDDSFGRKRLYTAWDNLKDEAMFFAGVDLLEAAGIRPSHLMVYMLVGYDKNETWARLFHRFNAMLARGVMPYPMVYGDKKRGLPLGGFNCPVEHQTLGGFQRWVLAGLYRAGVAFADYDVNARAAGPADEQPSLFGAAA
jgi:hypothetical protein